MLVAANIFQPLITVFEAVLKFFHNHMGISWGAAIVLLTILIRAILLPLAVKQFHSMQKLQRVAPEMKKIQAKYKDDKQRQQQEMMKLYQEHGVNPFGSCLPLVAQLPVFIALYYMLRKSLRGDICPGVQHAYQAHYAALHHVSLHVAAGQTTYCTDPHYAHFYHGGASFLFIPDLTNQAYGGVLIALIVLYVGSQLLSQLLMSTPQMDKTQRNMMLLLPLFFVIIMINFPAGVLVYWITTNVWTIGQQYVIRRRLGPMTPLTATAGDGGPPGGGGSGGGPSAGGNGAGTGGGGLPGLLKGLSRGEQEPEPAGAGTKARTQSGPPPPPPRKRKKRSGRRR
jgi:YidC/Oxa1 family membrane protein insertase